MESDKQRDVLLQVLGAEQFSQDARISVATSEAASRTSVFVFSLSSTLVALGLTGTDTPTFVPLLAGAFSVLFVIGVLTEVRLVGISLSNVDALRRIDAIRAYYATVHPDAPRLLGRPAAEREVVSQSLNVTSGWLASLSTTATMVGILNSVVAGIALSGGLTLIEAARPLIVGALVVAASTHAAAFGFYQQRRFRASELTAPEPGS